MPDEKELQAIKDAVVKIAEHVATVDEALGRIGDKLRGQRISTTFAIPRKLDVHAIRQKLNQKKA